LIPKTYIIKNRLTLIRTDDILKLKSYICTFQTKYMAVSSIRNCTFDFVEAIKVPRLDLYDWDGKERWLAFFMFDIYPI